MFPDSVYDIKINGLNGDTDILSLRKNKISLFVNIATKCGYSPTCSPVWSFARTSKQLWELQKVHEMYSEHGFSVVGFPCNQFGEMEPSANEEIHQFISKNYPFVTFPISEKIDVNGQNEHLVYNYLKGPEIRNHDDSTADMSDAAKRGQNLAMQAMMRIPHNWEKFLISVEGKSIARFNWQDTPLAEKPLYAGGSQWTIRQAIEMVLGI